MPDIPVENITEKEAYINGQRLDRLDIQGRMYLVDFGSASRAYAISRGSGNSFTAKEIESPEAVDFLKLAYRKERLVIQIPTDIIMQRNRRRANVIFYKHKHK